MEKTLPEKTQRERPCKSKRRPEKKGNKTQTSQFST